jgi:hypothetical protein
MFYKIIVWSEVWALLIPLAIIIIWGYKKKEMTPLVIYLVVALLIFSTGRGVSLMYQAKLAHKLPHFLKSNHPLYNINSVCRVLLFGWLILNSELLKNIKPLKFILPIYLLLVILDMTFWENPMALSTILTIAQCTLLLCFCILFFFHTIRDESEINWMGKPLFLICTALVLYEALNFFIFLFFHPIANVNRKFGTITMIISSSLFIIFCIMIAVALYRNRPLKKQIKTVP